MRFNDAGPALAFLSIIMIGEVRGDITINSMNPSPIGLLADLTANPSAPGIPVLSYTWTYKWTANGAVSDWLPAETNNAGSRNKLPTPGTYQFKCTIVYQAQRSNVSPYAPIQQPNDVFIATVTAMMPDAIGKVQGLGDKNPPSLGIEIDFFVTCGGQVCGEYVGGFPQEKLTNWIGNNDSDWAPTEMGATEFRWTYQAPIVGGLISTISNR